MIRAAGGVVTRRGEAGLEVLVVHRPKYGDWSLPKGKALRGESDEVCAPRRSKRRPVCTVSSARSSRPPGTTTRVAVRSACGTGSMTPVAGELAFRHEVDDGRWLSLEDAREILSYARDVQVIGFLEAKAGGPTT